MAHVVFHPEEKRIVEMRRHPIVLFLQLSIFAIIMIIPFIFFLFFIFSDQSLTFGPILSTFLTLGLSVFYLYVMLFALHSTLDYILDIWLVTNQRVVNIEQKGLFNVSKSEQEISRIQDITAEVKGILPTLLNYGNVYIQTAAEKERFVFKQVRDPNNVVRILSTLLEEQYKKSGSHTPHQVKKAPTIKYSKNGKKY